MLQDRGDGGDGDDEGDRVDGDDGGDLDCLSRQDSKNITNCL